MPTLKTPSSTGRAALAAALRKHTVDRVPLWKGPMVDGVTQSMLGKFLFDRERFRLMTVEGLKEADRFNHRLEYGNMWHVCEEAHAANIMFVRPLMEYCQGLVRKYGNASSVEIDKWYQVCRRQFPIYIDHWKKHPDVKGRKPVYQEQVFQVPYKLPSGRTVLLKGKMDAVDLIPKDQHAPAGLYIQENKTKGDYTEERIIADLPWDLQSGVYLTALHNMPLPKGIDGKYPINGVRYNVVRRPLGGQKYNIRQKKGLGKAKKGAQTTEEYYDELGKLIAGDPKFFFFRAKMEYPLADLVNFQKRCLNPLLEQLCDWWDYIMLDPFNPWRDNNHIHFQMPCGVYNPLMEGRSTEYDRFLLTGDAKGLRQITTLFGELEI